MSKIISAVNAQIRKMIVIRTGSICMEVTGFVQHHLEKKFSILLE